LLQESQGGTRAPWDSRDLKAEAQPTLSLSSDSKDERKLAFTTDHDEQKHDLSFVGLGIVMEIRLASRGEAAVRQQASMRTLCVRAKPSDCQVLINTLLYLKLTTYTRTESGWGLSDSTRQPTMSHA
jgi:hypothetical protein